MSHVVTGAVANDECGGRLRSRPIVCLALALALAVCGCTKISTRSGSPAQTGAAPIPGVLRYADIAEPDSLSTLLSTQLITADLSYLMFSYFFNVDDHNNLVPEIATVVPTVANGGISADGKTITYHMRHGVRWQDGAPLTSRDIVFTYQAIMNPRNNVQLRVGYDQIASVQAPDPYTVVVHMRSVFSPIVAYFMGIQGGFSILPAHLLAQYPDLNHAAWNNAPIGSGPFKFVEWEHGDHITLEANPLYWRGPPKLHKIIFRFVPDTNTIVTLLQTHEIDAWFRAEPGKVNELRAIPGYRITLTPENVFGHLDFNTRDPILSDVIVRRALESAIDRPRIVADATKGVYTVTDTDLSTFSWALDHHPMFFPYDPARARTLLDEDGWKVGPDGIRVKNGTRLSLQLSYVGGQSIAEEVGALIQEEAKAVGIEITQKPYQADLYFAAAQDGGILNLGKYQIAYYSWASGVDPDDSSLYRCNQFPPQGQNVLFWCDPKVEAAEVDALSHMDQGRRKADYHVIATELGSQAPTVFLTANRRLDIVPVQMTGFKPSPAESANWNAYDWAMR
ncbi:MAG TPA: peptide ABC transporter substrate-binding protein [Candidatus Acidoferrales bacterium]|nr:peptide ABC transporter substrate-binding protein [Candidatus Acidoferrales bacterium]